MQNGDFVKIDFVGKVAGTGQVFDYTQEAVAKKEGLFDPKQEYKPVLVIIGANMVIPGVEKQLETMKPGEEREFSVQQQEGFGQRNPHMVKVFSLSHFLKNNMNPSPGTFVRIEGLQGKVQSVSGGRVRVDFNHPLAGKELHYWVKVIGTVSKPEDKAKELFSHYGIKHGADLKEGVLTVSGNPGEEEQKHIQQLVTRWIKDVKDIKFSE